MIKISQLMMTSELELWSVSLVGPSAVQPLLFDDDEDEDDEDEDEDDEDEDEDEDEEDEDDDDEEPEVRTSRLVA